MKNPLAKYQTILLLGWGLFWLGGMILPGSVGNFSNSLRDILFVLLSGLTVWIGYRLAYKAEGIILFYMDWHIRIVHRLRGAKEAAGLSRQYRRSADMRQAGQINLVVGGICLAVGLYYLLR